MPRLKVPLIFRSTFGIYAAAEIVGEGANGKIYRATDERNGVVAIKLLDPAKGLSTERQKRFKNELLFGIRNRHPNVVTILDHGPYGTADSATAFYVMPLYGSTLRQAIQSRIAPANVLPQFGQILNGVEAAHLQHVIHRDLKPENILHDVAPTQWVVADFGVASFAQDELYTSVDTHPNSRLANFQYAAPEQRTRGASVDVRADIYALGLILNEMFTGIVPHGTEFRTVVAVAPEYAYVDELIESMIRQDPARRPASIDVVKKELLGRRNTFVERQRLDALRQEVVPASGLTDPIALDPIRLTDFDWDRGRLTLKLSQPVNPSWIQAIQFGPYSHSSIMGKGPETFSFAGDTATVSVEHNSVQRMIDHFKDWLPHANRIYAERMGRQLQDEQERQRRGIEQEIELRDQRLRVLRDVKI